MRVDAVAIPPISGVHQVRISVGLNSIDLYPIIFIPADSFDHAKRIVEAINNREDSAESR